MSERYKVDKIKQREEVGTERGALPYRNPPAEMSEKGEEKGKSGKSQKKLKRTEDGT